MFSQTFVVAAVPWDLLSRVAENCWFVMATYKPMLKLVLAVLLLAVCLNSVAEKRSACLVRAAWTTGFCSHKSSVKYMYIDRYIVNQYYHI